MTRVVLLCLFQRKVDLRVCIQVSEIIAVSNFDPHPKLRVDDLVERVGTAQYITTLDLSKGYWQPAFAPEAS